MADIIPMVLNCRKCKKPLPADVFNTPDLAKCPHCGVTMLAAVYPAFYRPPEKGRLGEDLMMAEESNCFYHPAKRAVRPCESCGRFLCTLCDIAIAGRHLCSGCVESGKKKGKISSLQKSKVLYHEITLVLGLLSMLIAYFAIVLAPVAIYMGVRYWNTQSSVLGHTRWKAVVGMVCAVIGLLLFGLFAAAISGAFD
jgi:hypothetical protein